MPFQPQHPQSPEDAPIARFAAGGVRGEVHRSAEAAAAAAARAVGDHLRELIAARGRAIGLFDSAPTQARLLDALARESLVWTRVIALQPGELAGFDEESPQSRRFALIDRLMRRVPIVEFHGLRGEAANLPAVAANYATLLAARPPDFAVLDLGPQGEIGFLPAREADPDDGAAVRIVGAGRALAVSLPVILACRRLFLFVAGEDRRAAVRQLLSAAAPASPAAPASRLRAHADVSLFLDPLNAPDSDSAS